MGILHCAFSWLGPLAGGNWGPDTLCREVVLLNFYPPAWSEA